MENETPLNPENTCNASGAGAAECCGDTSAKYDAKHGENCAQPENCCNAENKCSASENEEQGAKGTVAGENCDGSQNGGCNCASDSEDLDAELEQVRAGQVKDLQAQIEQLTDEVARRKADIFNLQQEYNNYVKRSKAEIASARSAAAGDVVEDLLPVLDELALARKHGDLTDGPFKAIATKLESILGQNYGLSRYGEAGEAFDPNIHDALMATVDASVSVATIKEVIQPGYKLGDKIVRAARVLVANPE